MPTTSADSDIPELVASLPHRQRVAMTLHYRVNPFRGRGRLLVGEMSEHKVRFEIREGRLEWKIESSGGGVDPDRPEDEGSEGS
jgi:hypothetical protein